MVVTGVVVVAVAVIHSTTALPFPLQNIPQDTSHSKLLGHDRCDTGLKEHFFQRVFEAIRAVCCLWRGDVGYFQPEFQPEFNISTIVRPWWRGIGLNLMPCGSQPEESVLP
jgi:hypothetical protein